MVGSRGSLLGHFTPFLGGFGPYFGPFWPPDMGAYCMILGIWGVQKWYPFFNPFFGHLFWDPHFGTSAETTPPILHPSYVGPPPIYTLSLVYMVYYPRIRGPVSLLLSPPGSLVYPGIWGPGRGPGSLYYIYYRARAVLFS